LLLRCRFLRCWLLGLGWLLLGCRFLRGCFLGLGRSLLGRASTLACASGSCFCFRWLCLGCGLLGFGGLLLWCGFGLAGAAGCCFCFGLPWLAFRESYGVDGREAVADGVPGFAAVFRDVQ